MLLSQPQPLQPEIAPPFVRLTDEELARMAQASPSPPAPGLSEAQLEELREWTMRLNQFFLGEGVAGLVRQSRGRDGMAVSFGPSWAKETASGLPPTVFLAAEPYTQIVRLVERRTPVRLAVRLETPFYRDASLAFNLTAEIPAGRERTKSS